MGFQTVRSNVNFDLVNENCQAKGVVTLTKVEFYRRLAGLSTVELAGVLGVHPSNISHLERLYRKPWPQIRHRLAEVLGVTETELFGPDGWPLSLDVEDVLENKKARLMGLAAFANGGKKEE